MPVPRARRRPPTPTPATGSTGDALVQDARRAAAEPEHLGGNTYGAAAWYVIRHGRTPESLAAYRQALSEDAERRGIEIRTRRRVPDD